MQASPARPRPASNLELYSWFFMRISAVAMILLVGFHLFYMHVILGVDAIDFDVIAGLCLAPLRQRRTHRAGRLCPPPGLARDHQVRSVYRRLCHPRPWRLRHLYLQVLG
jgi:hypothetical protein